MEENGRPRPVAVLQIHGAALAAGSLSFHFLEGGFVGREFRRFGSFTSDGLKVATAVRPGLLIQDRFIAARR